MGDHSALTWATGASSVYDTSWENHLEEVVEYNAYYSRASHKYLQGFKEAIEAMPGSDELGGQVPGDIVFNEKNKSKRPIGIHHDDTPDGAVSNVIQKEEKFVESRGDGVLLDRLHAIKELLEQYGKPTEVTVTVGQSQLYSGEEI